MDAFIQKMRRLKGVRKQLIVEEAWKALSSANMAEYLKYMYKTVRKYFGEAIVVTQGGRTILLLRLLSKRRLSITPTVKSFSTNENS